MNSTRFLRALCLLVAISVHTASCGAQDFEDVTLNIQQPRDDNSQEALKRPERVTVVAPRNLRPQSDYHVLVSLANSEAPATIDLQLTGARDSNREQTDAKSVLIQSGETQTLKFKIGDWPPAEYTLSATAHATDRSWNFTQEATLTYRAKTYSAFIQTDKAIYKPGQLVQFRALFLTQNLSPLAMKEEINVTISDSKRNLIKQWTGLSNWRGLLTLDLQLSEDPVLGDWTIKVEARQQEVSKRFKVAEYILPTFDVSIQLPKYATYNESSIVATVSASYTYGKPVSGHATLTVQPLVRLIQIDTRPLNQAQFRARLVNGSADFDVDVLKDLKQGRDLFERAIEFFALVEEDLTGRKYNRTELMKVHDKNVRIEQLNEAAFKPGLSYLLQFKVAYQDETPVEDGGPELELRYGVPGRTLERLKLRPIGGLAESLIEIPRKVPSSQSAEKLVAPSLIELQITYRGQVHYLNPLTPFISDSQQYMKISLPQLETAGSHQQRGQSSRTGKIQAPSVSVNDDLRIKVRATEGMQQVTCQGLARGDIIWALSPDAKNRTEFEFEVKIDQRMAPEAMIMCYYIRTENKEMIADVIRVPVSGQVRNIVKISTSREEAKPGQEVEVGIFTKPNSVVGVLGIDQSVLLLKSGNDISKSDLAEDANLYGGSTAAQVERARNAGSLFESADVVVLSNNLIYNGLGFREGRLLYMNAAFGSSESPVAAYRSIALDSIILEHELTPPEFHIKRPKEEPAVIRSLFPETWLWENATAGADGTVRFKSKIPDSITSWVLSAFSINENFGLGLSTGKTSVRVFRLFFIKLNLPYSIIRGETVSIQAIVFNYSKRPTAAKVTLENANGDFEFVEAANNVEDEQHRSESAESKLIRVPAEDGAAVSFLIRPRKLGPIDIRVTAQGELARDGLVQKLLVKPEGQTQHLNKALLINLPAPQSTLTRNFSIEVPANAVAGSQKVFVSAVGDILGAGLSNVDDLLRLPYGCGEQNMINLVPNIVILNYLQNSKRLRESQRAKAVKNIEAGYQRQLNYKRTDGSFSAFGNSDQNGSVWLTAYVLKSLQQAKSIITVDEKVIRRAANFIARFARPDGSIEEVGMLHNKQLQSFAADQNSAYLTAYCMIALLQRPIAADSDAPAPVPLDEVLERGLNFLERQLEELVAADSVYELAIISYALHLANRPAAADRAYEQLWTRAREERELVWWESGKSLKAGGDDNEKLLANEGSIEREFETIGRTSTSTTPPPPPPLKPLPVNTKHSAHLFIPDSLSIEMTSLALLTIVRRGELDRALPVVRWLISQQNSNGGFASTQDTVLAIEALAAFAGASAASKAAPSIDMELVYPRVGRQRTDIRRNSVDQLLITGSNALVNQQIRLPDNITWVQLQATGSGAAVVQISWQYNLLVSAEQPAFYLSPILDKTSNINYLQLSICTFYKAGDSSNMAVMEVELPSGYVADVEALPGLTRHKDVKRIDTSDGDTKVQIYLDKVSREELCVTVPAHRTSKVSGNKPVPVSIYDYYNRQQAARIFYEPQQASSCDICDQDSCGDSCFKKPRKSDRLVSLHEQRKISNQQMKQMSANLTNSSGKNSSPAIQLLPLAPIFMTLMSVTRGLINT